MSLFAIAVKSTLDKFVHDLAVTNGYGYADADGSYMSADVVESEAPALIWSFSHFAPAPLDPFYHLRFEIEAKTSNDISQYDSLTLTSRVQEAFFVGLGIPVLDYSKLTTPTTQTGSIIIASAEMAPAGFDKTAGVRPVLVTANVLRTSP